MGRCPFLDQLVAKPAQFGARAVEGAGEVSHGSTPAEEGECREELGLPICQSIPARAEGAPTELVNQSWESGLDVS